MAKEPGTCVGDILEKHDGLSGMTFVSRHVRLSQRALFFVVKFTRMS